jgi:haloacetate dehalogenase
MAIPGFSAGHAAPNGVDIAYEIGGNGPPLLLLHGYPQTRAMWARIAPRLAETHTVICPDLRGYGDSGKPADVANYSFREMAADMLGLMAGLGHERFAVAGHDRGARVTHRLALDAPQAVSRACVMDIVPTHTLLSELHKDVAASYYHWFFLAQPAPFPETMIGHDPDRYYESCLLGWGGASLADFNEGQLAAYRAAWHDKEVTRGMCNDYRAALLHDFEDDAQDLGARLKCPTLALYGADGVMAKNYDVAKVWAEKCTQVEARAIPGGHFFPDTAPKATTAALQDFLEA